MTTTTRRLTDAQALSALERAADELFYQHGITGVTVAAVRDRSGVSLRRIYTLCPTKADLVSLWLRYRHTTWTADMHARIASKLHAATNGVDAVFDALQDWMIETDFRGCGFINTHAEVNELTPEHQQIIRDHKRALAEYLDEITGNGASMAVIVDGAIIRASMFNDIEPITDARRIAHTLTSTATPAKAHQ